MGTAKTRFLPRNVAPLVRETLTDTPITVIQGARQVGKSTLVQNIAAEWGGVVVSLDEGGMLEAARADPDGFLLLGGQSLLVIDELQRAPELVRALKAAVDQDRRPGRFLVTGSADLLSLPGSSDSLAGRAETIVLHGFSQGELSGVVEDFASSVVSYTAATKPGFSSDLTRKDVARKVAAGGYPDAVERTGTARARWFSNYLYRIVRRDATEVSRLQFTDRLDRLLKLIAANNSGELVIAHLARDADIPATSLPPYLKLLEQLYLIHTVPAWGHNLTKRVVGRPKVSILDSGLAAHLIGFTEESLRMPVGSARFGAQLEGFVAGELRKQQSWSRVPYSLHHFRDRDLAEVDLIVEMMDGSLIALEVKARSTARHTDFRGLEFLKKRLGDAFLAGFVLNLSPRTLPFGDRLWSAPIELLWAETHR